MASLTDYADVLSAEMIGAWPAIAAVLPAGSQLVGGTALALHLRHRRSYDLDVFTAETFDAGDMAARLAAVGVFRSQRLGPGALFGHLNGVKIEISHVGEWEQLGVPMQIAGLDVASLPDLMAGKLTALAERAEMRDYFDVMCIERETGLRIEEGLILFARKWGLGTEHPDVHTLVLRLGNPGGMTDDPLLRSAFGDRLRARLERYFADRHPDIVASFQQRYDKPEPGTPSPQDAGSVGPARDRYHHSHGDLDHRTRT